PAPALTTAPTTATATATAPPKPPPFPLLTTWAVPTAGLLRKGETWHVQHGRVEVRGHREPLAAGVDLPMIQIPAGRFLMGSPSEEEEHSTFEGPQHEVSLESFLMGQTPITQAQWQAVAEWRERPGERWGRQLKLNPSHFADQADSPQRPVEQVSWQDAMEFCSRLSQRTGRRYTLPSEAQWEYACRAGSTTPFAFGETLTPELANYNARFTYANGPKGVYLGHTTPVGTFPANAWGLVDMHGNVWEWCLDEWRDTYVGAPVDGSAWVAGAGESRSTARLLRGGSWVSDPHNCRSAYRNRDHPDNLNQGRGFRVCCLPQD
ncbi:MAG: formylglycine-generating enzyme family protein, partial [Cyanobacteria bacterium K_Offshore_surface_m2_239]|nr:formylglycine-generating enzyme family protein [Cyanobacteria bacterium K_Offshore_surface_m2_239]